MKKISLTLFVLGIAALIAAQVTPVEIRKSPFNPIIDGRIDAVWYSVNSNSIYKPFRSETPSLGAAGETFWKALWADDGIYFLVSVTDNAFYPSYAVNPEGNNWEYDKAEIYLDVNPELKDGYGPGFGSGHYVFAPGFTKGKNDGTLFTDLSGYKYAIMVKGSNYIYEMFIPFSILTDKNGTPVSGTSDIGFDVTIIDRDPGTPSRSRAVWANVGTIDESWNNMDDCGKITLSDLSFDFDKLNLLKDGTFQNDGPLTEPWRTWTNMIGTTEVVDGVCKIVTTTVGAEYENQLYQKGWKASNDSVYLLVFTVWGSPDRNFYIHFEDDPAHGYTRLGTSDDPESNGQASWTIPVTSTPVTWTLRAKACCITPTSEPSLMIMTGDHLGTIYIDNIAIINETDLKSSSGFNVDLPGETNVFCGEPLELNPFIEYHGSEALNFSWSPSEGLSAADIRNPLVNVNSDIVYTLTTTAPGYDPILRSIKIKVSPTVLKPAICVVNVDENNKNVILLKKEESQGVESYLIYRESALQAGQYDLIGLVPYSGEGVFVDEQSDARVQSNKYKVAIKDKCGFFSAKSAEHKTLHLTISQGVGNDWNLFWEPYGGVPISSYKILRGTSASDLTEIASTAGGNMSYTDLTAPAGNLYYQVQGVLSEPCSTLKSTEYGRVLSNIIRNFNNSVVTGTGFSEKELIYPNPAGEKIRLRNVNKPEARVMFYNSLGMEVLSGQFPEEIDISKLSKGIYFVKVIDSGKIYVNKLIKK